MKVKEKQKLTMQQLGALADAFNRSIITIQRWYDNKDDRLTSEKAKAALKKVVA